MLGRNPIRRHHRCHRFDALALPRQHQPAAIVMQRARAIGMAKNAAQRRDIRLKTILDTGCNFCHHANPRKQRIDTLPNSTNH